MLALLCLCSTWLSTTDAFVAQRSSNLPISSSEQQQQQHYHHQQRTRLILLAAKGFGVTVEREIKEAATSAAKDDEDDNMTNKLPTLEVKRRLLDLLPRMMGTPEEFKLVESYINVLEDRYQPVQTLDFLNLALQGDWQLLFSTNLLSGGGGPKSNFRIKEMYQSIQTNKLEGTIQNCVAWDLAQQEDDEQDNNKSPVIFDASGTMTVKNSYKISQGARMVMDLDDHVLALAKGSTVPKDVEGLVGLLHRAMPKELFDPSEHAMDTTYLDGDLRLVRLTGPRFEGIRNVFIRRGSMEINPV